MVNALRAGFALLTLAAIGTQLYLQVDAGLSVVNFFSFFTILSNLLAAVVMLAAVFRLQQRRHATAAEDVVRATATTCMAIVGIVFSVLLAGADLGPLLPWINAVTHYVMPAVVVADWLLSPPSTVLSMARLPLMLAFPLVYLTYTMVRGAAVGFYPYPFVNPATAGGYSGVAAYCAAILVTFVIAAALTIAMGNRLRSRRPEVAS